MRFAHLADIHLGAWRAHPELYNISFKVFENAIDTVIQRGVDFVLISGDLFHSSIPDISLIAKTIEVLKKLKTKSIPVYAIPGSHDFSPSGKTVLTILEKADMLKLVNKGIVENEKFKPIFVEDKTGAKISGMVGRKKGLEKKIYENIDYSLLNEDGVKIFMFHSAVEEICKIPYGEFISFSDLPKSFSYYAGGHVHDHVVHKYNGGLIVYPGELYPNNFKELEDHKQGGFCIVEISDSVKVERIVPSTPPVESIVLCADDKTSSEVEKELINKCKSINAKNKIILIRIYGTMKSGKPSDINFDLVTQILKDAIAVKKNIYDLRTKEFKEIKTNIGKSLEEIENSVIKEHPSEKFDEIFVKEMMNVLSQEKHEDETSVAFQERVKRDAYKILGVEYED